MVLEATVSVEEDEVKGWCRETEREMRTGWEGEGRPQASILIGRLDCRLRTWMRVCGLDMVENFRWWFTLSLW